MKAAAFLTYLKILGLHHTQIKIEVFQMIQYFEENIRNILLGQIDFL